MTEEGIAEEVEKGEVTDMNEYTQLYGDKPEKTWVINDIWISLEIYIE